MIPKAIEDTQKHIIDFGQPYTNKVSEPVLVIWKKMVFLKKTSHQNKPPSCW